MSNDLRFMRQLHLLTPSQIQELSSCMTEASLSYELKCGEEWRQIFRVKTYKYRLGYISRVYLMLSKMHHTKIECLARAMSK
jgi:hypothetical protein